ncbi:MAG: SDR family NAD(P)-dependent oxidoreductase [Halioglobus sp.]|nr:SDR family NAD(P)-dependent oxidoreductase [Halioglobus sp.]
MKKLGTFSITPGESLDFARVSGDSNPLHLDPVAARRTRFGQTLIHGVCGTLKCLNLLLKHRGVDAELASIKVKYNKPATQGQALEAFAQVTDNLARIELFADGSRCQVIELALRDAVANGLPPEAGLRACSEAPAAALDLSIDDCQDLSGEVELYWDAALMNALFPHATRHLPARQLALLLGSTQIVGMKCPGLHSVFAQLDVRFAPADAGTSGDGTLQYRVLRTDPRIDRVELHLENAIGEGTVEAFFRPPPVQQAGFAQIATLVADGEFSQQHALVVGGSRGLGEVISKVLAAGGANTLITYAAGRDDAARVAGEIGSVRTAPVIAPYDVLEGSLSPEMETFCASVTHIYYLASPTIAKSDSKEWNRPLFSRYCDFYIDGLATLMQQVMQQGDGNRELQLFIPSSVFLEQSIKGFDEYIAAKAAAEAFATCFEKKHRNCTVVAPRLPRLYTDQTSSIKDIDEQQTLKVIIDQLRSYNAAGSPTG